MVGALENIGIFASVTTVGTYLGAETVAFMQHPPHVLDPGEFLSVLHSTDVASGFGVLLGTLAGIIISGILIGKNTERLDWKNVGNEYKAGRQERADLEARYGEGHATNILRSNHGLPPIRQRRIKP